MTFAPILQEIQQESATTRRLMERIPDDKLGWRPHAKSLPLGQLAMHTAMIPGAFARIGQLDEFDVATASFTPPTPASTAEVLDTLDASTQAAVEFIGGLDAARAGAPWRLLRGSTELFNMPRGAMLRALMLNHWYHHRGQLSVYLRMLDVPMPSIYGPSADENPFG